MSEKEGGWPVSVWYIWCSKRVKQRKTSKLSPVRPKKVPFWHYCHRLCPYTVYAFFFDACGSELLLIVERCLRAHDLDE